MPRRPALLLALLVAVSGPSQLFAQQPDVVLPPSAHVAFVDGLATIEREGEVEPIEPGMPLVDGDRLTTSAGRIELLFGNGSTLYVDEFSTLDLLSPTFLRLVNGGVTFDVSQGPGVPASAVLYELDTPAASVTLNAPGEYRILAPDDGARFPGAPAPVEPTTIVEVVRGAARLASDVARTDLRTGEQSAVRNGEPPTFPVRFNSAQWTPFTQWVELRRSDRHDVSASRRYLPQDVQAYATTFDRNGTWGVEAEVGPVWYPTVGGGWRPYHNGRWTWIPRFGWTWVGHDTWAWPTHHYGRWGLNTHGSWYWIPGRQWSPAWVSWAIGSTFVSWCPLGFNGLPVVGFSRGPSYVYGRVFDPDFAWTTIPGHAFGTSVVAGRIAIAGRRSIDRTREPFILQHSPPARPRTGPRFSSPGAGRVFVSRRGGPNAPRVERERGPQNRADQGPENRHGVEPRRAVPRTMIGMPAPAPSRSGDRPRGGRPRMTLQGAHAPAPQGTTSSPFLSVPRALPQTHYGIPPAVPPLTPRPTFNAPASNAPAAGARQVPAPYSRSGGVPARTAVPRSQAAPSAAHTPRAGGGAAPAAGGTASGSTSQARQARPR
jgi:hypothetical protein